MAYSEAKKAETLALLAANKGKLRETAKQAKVSLSTLQKWVAGEHLPEGLTEKVVAQKESLADRCEDLANLLLGDMSDPKKREKAPVAALAMAFGVAVDKMRLLRGESTQTVEIRDDGHVFSLLLPEALSGGEAAATEPADAKREG